MELSAAQVLGLLALGALAACAPFEPQPAPAVEARAPKVATPPESRSAEARTAEAKPAAPPAAPPAVDAATAAPDQAGPPATEPVATALEKAGAPAAKAEAPAGKPPAKAPDAPAPKRETAVPAKPSAPPPLDLNALEKRLKDTDAIGVFTKLTLKNQVDDLLVQFEAHHGGANRVSLAELRQPYDLLIIKVLSLLQDRDTPLASDLLRSREAIWSILSDPARFQRLVNENRS